MSKQPEADRDKFPWVAALAVLGGSALIVVLLMGWQKEKPQQPVDQAESKLEVETRRAERTQWILERTKSDSADTREDAARKLGEDDSAPPGGPSRRSCRYSWTTYRISASWPGIR